MHISAEEAAVVNISIGAGLAWGSSGLNQRRAQRDTRTTVRREAYAALILALDHLERAWTAPETLEDEYGSKNMGEVTGHAVREIQRSYVTVLLVGSKKAKSAARKVQEAAWALNDRLSGTAKSEFLRPKLSKVFDNFSAAAKEFIEIAESESDG